ncbi:hypothetical protein [Parendozoicomonas sp. Alg238-R29]|uniref:hypothetical protein n=1 Tax=Parendozoicomonas sp. Alg238-R29 TaxID=2993446 RepID=UPI00248D8954|nr:hypothetical protein [Parendozoicomonas sp. Alg238-R29]
MAGVGGIGQNQTQQTEYLRHAEQTQRADQASAGNAAGSVTVSYYEPGMQAKGADGRVVPLAAPDAGATQGMGKMDTNELSAMLSGLRADNEDAMQKASEEAALASKEKVKSARDKRIQELEKALEPPPKKNKKCAAAKIVIGAMLPGVGTPLMVQGIKELKAYNSEVKSVNGERNLVMQQHFQQNHGEVKEFNKEYTKDYTDSDYQVKGGKVGNRINPDQHIAKLEDMKSRGVIDESGFQELKGLVEEGAKPREVYEAFLGMAIEGKVNGEAASIHGENASRGATEAVGEAVGEAPSDDGSVTEASASDTLAEAAEIEEDQGFQQFLAELAMMMEEQEEGFRQIEEDLTSGASLALSGAQDMQMQQSMTMRHI